MSVRIVSGGQTGVDRAALDVAIHLKIEHSGWCPRGRRAEDGVISDSYDLKETASDCYEDRTLFNIRDSEVTLILVPNGSEVNAISDGTKLTVQELTRLSKPYLIIKVCDQINESLVEECVEWLSTHKPKIVNIAGPRESTCPGIYATSYALIKHIFHKYKLSMDNS